LSPFYLTRSRLRREERDGRLLLADIQKAVALDEDNWRAWRAQTEFYEKRGDFEKALKSAGAIYKQQPDKPALAMDYAKALLHSGKYEECLEVLGKTNVLPYEGAREGHDLYRQANLFLAAGSLRNGTARKAAEGIETSRLWPENLGVGRPFEVDERLENFLAAAVAEKTGGRKKAEGYYKAVCADAEKFGGSWDAVQLPVAIAFKKTGQENRAVRVLADWRTAKGEADPVFTWAFAIFQNDWEKADDVLAKLKQAPAGAAWDMGTGDRYFPLVRAIVQADE
jgi:tetratricopeptide (TPR) repeat protein